MKKIILAILLGLMLSFSASSVDAKTTKSHKKFLDATFALFVVTHDTYSFECTATAIEKTADGYKLLTAGHCVSDGLPLAVAEDITEGLTYYPVTVIKFRHDGHLDFALLSLKTSRKYEVMPLIYGYKPEIDTKVENVNFTDGIAKIVSDGRVSTQILTTYGAKGDCDQCHNHFMVQIFAGPGASGSAVVDSKLHRVIGIVTGGSEFTLGAFVEPLIYYPEFLAAQ